MENGESGKKIYIFPVLYIISVYLFPYLFFLLNKGETQETASGGGINLLPVLLPLIFGVANIFGAIGHRDVGRDKFMRCMLLLKLGLIPFYILGGACIALALLLMFTPVVIMVFVGPVIAVVFSVTGWIVLLLSSPFSILYIIKAYKEDVHPRSLCIAALIAQYFFVLDVVFVIVLFLRERKNSSSGASMRVLL